MKMSKCPLCGKDPETQYYSEEKGHDEFWITGCPDCDLFSGITAASKKISQADWNNLVSKFPPIMRVQVGDKIIISPNFSEIITDVNITEGYMKVSDTGQIAFPMDVVKWPWSLNRKGASNENLR